MTKQELDDVATKAMPPAKKTRKVIKKELFICRGEGGTDPDSAATFEVVAGPMKDVAQAFIKVRDDLPDGKYVLMYEGRTLTKSSETVAKVTM